MRSDYALYVVAIICLALATVVFATNQAGIPLMAPPIDVVTMGVLVVLGVISTGAGYLIRPGEMILGRPSEPLQPELRSESSTQPTPSQSKSTRAPPINITEIRGIGQKRAEQLRALGINTAQDLVETTASTLADKIELSPKVTRKWVSEAKRLIKEDS
jgi:hypothetical protein